MLSLFSTQPADSERRTGASAEQAHHQGCELDYGMAGPHRMAARNQAEQKLRALRRSPACHLSWPQVDGFRPRGQLSHPVYSRYTFSNTEGAQRTGSIGLSSVCFNSFGGQCTHQLRARSLSFSTARSHGPRRDMEMPQRDNVPDPKAWYRRREAVGAVAKIQIVRVDRVLLCFKTDLQIPSPPKCTSLHPRVRGFLEHPALFMKGAHTFLFCPNPRRGSAIGLGT